MSDLPPNPPLVLAVDNEADTADSLAALVTLWGMRARVANTARAALTAAAESCPAAVVLDVVLPDMSGWDLARKLRELPGMRDTLIVVVTGLGRPEDYARSRDAGCPLHLLKPTEPEVLRQLLTSLHARKDLS